MTTTISQHHEAFLAAVKGFTAGTVVRAMNSMDTGTRWGSCGKGHMAERYALAHTDSPIGRMYRSLKGLDLAVLRAKCQEFKDETDRARARKEQERLAIEQRRKARTAELLKQKQERDAAEAQRAADLAAVRKAFACAMPMGLAAVQLVLTQDEFAAMARVLGVQLQPQPDLCHNCDTAMPEGCGGLFKGESDCRLHTKG